MNFNNNTNKNQNSSNLKGSWGSFGSKFEGPNNYKIPKNPAISSSTPNTNFTNTPAPQFEASKILEFGNRIDSMLGNQQGFADNSNVKGDRMDSFGANRQPQSNNDDYNNGRGFGNRMDSFGGNRQPQSNYNNSNVNRDGSFGANWNSQSNFADSNVKGSGDPLNSYGGNRQPQSNYNSSNVNRDSSFGANWKSQSNFVDSNVKGSGDPLNSFGGNRQPQSNFKPYSNNFGNNMDSFRGNQQSNPNFGNSSGKDTGFGGTPNTFNSGNSFQNSMGSFRPNRNNNFNNKSNQNISGFNNSGNQQRNQQGSNNFGNNNRAGSGQNDGLNKQNSRFSNNNRSNNANNDNSKGGDSNYVPFRKFRQFYTNRQHQDPETSFNDKTPAPSLFMGRDPTYPEELNTLMNPFYCNLCNCRLNSIKTSNVHYVSKPHDKQITKWFKTNFEDKGLATPEIKRFVTEEKTGCYPCTVCNLDLTSPQHALQHYNGKRHRTAASKITPPIGIGYYNVEGKWIQTGKLIDKETGKEATYIMVDTPSGSEPVVLFAAPGPKSILKKPANPDSTEIEGPPAKIPKKTPTTIMTPDSTTNNQSINPESNFYSQLQIPQNALDTKECKICGVTTTSYDQMLLHLKGRIHSRKLKALGESPLSDIFGKSPSTSNTIMESIQSFDPLDISMFRTPTGNYYCQPCNAPIPSEDGIKKHIESNSHLNAMRKKA